MQKSSQKFNTKVISFPNANFKGLLALRFGLRFVIFMILGEKRKHDTLIYKKFERY